MQWDGKHFKLLTRKNAPQKCTANYIWALIAKVTQVIWKNRALWHQQQYRATKLKLEFLVLSSISCVFTFVCADQGSQLKQHNTQVTTLASFECEADYAITSCLIQSLIVLRS